MKVPFLQKRIKAEFLNFVNELESGVAASVAACRSGQTAHEMYRITFPLFVLIRIMTAESYVRNPVREVVLQELKSSPKAAFLSALNTFNKATPFRAEISHGLRQTIFTGYINELASDLLLLLNSYYLRNYRGALIAIRCSLEDLYRHLFYRDHPQEYWAIARNPDATEASLGISPKTLREWLTKTEYLSFLRGLTTTLEEKTGEGAGDFFTENEALYATCSGHVHGSSTQTLSLFQSNLDLVYIKNRDDDVQKTARRFVEVAITFLAAAHTDSFAASDEYERSMVLSIFDKGRRSRLRKALGV